MLKIEVSLPELAQNVRFYHLRHSQRNITDPREQVRRPRHFLLYRVKDDMTTVEIGRLLHDTMDFELHFPQDFWPEQS